MIDPEVSQRKYTHAVTQLELDAQLFIADDRWEVISRDYPLFEVVFTHPRSKRRIGFRFSFDGWDARPPSLDLFEPTSGALLEWSKWPKNTWSVGESHPITKRPFLCHPGIREYHDHPSHANDLWEPLRGLTSYTMLELIGRVNRRFADSDG